MTARDALLQPKPATAQLAAGRVGVLLLNLGTPEGTGYAPMRRYLKEFLSDRRVIEEPRWKWWPILNLVILTVRPGRKGRDYDKIWNRERDESPLKTITRAQAEKLAAALGGKPVVVEWAMRYGTPSAAPVIARLQQEGCDRILLVPLYPQYAAATTATACDQVFRALMDMRWQPTIRVVPPYYADPAYIEALSVSIRAHLSTLDFEPDVLLASFHGMPLKYFEKGDPYYLQCEETSRLLREKLQWPAGRWHTTYQSRFGSDRWLEPATIDTVAELARSGIKKLALVAPGFAADCLETLEELAMENRSVFLEAGGEKFACIPCLNDSPEHIGMLEKIIRRELLGWL
ncbi:MAG TPA: ferrochelatase [Hyphomicrobiaceae bacterium]|nr:ferrochelatase [Hyphomicrobiaceae bacterium]